MCQWSKNQIKYEDFFRKRIERETNKQKTPIIKLLYDSLFYNLSTFLLQNKGTWAIRLNKKQLSYKQQLSRLSLLSLQKRKFRSVIKISKIVSAIEMVGRDQLVFFQYKIHQMVSLYYHLGVQNFKTNKKK